MKKFRLALMALAVISFTGLYSCGSGMTDKDAQKAADSLVNAMNDAMDQAVQDADQTVVKDTAQEEVTDTTAAPTEESAETGEGTEDNVE